ncbi:MAG TPA: hypothetical protein VER96_25530 [Polyangiaceae bacterium]|nr:hypothetical protein [Polyangiaceae bacterium]
MSRVTEQRGASLALDEADELVSRVTPVIPPPADWLRDLGDGVPDLTAPRAATEEDVFWSTPPRYSLLVSLAPSSPAPSRRTWGMRLLFVTLACAVVTLLVHVSNSP